MNPVLHLSLPVDDLARAEAFYAEGLGCQIGRRRSDWIDVWFYGLQLTLQHRPAETSPVEKQGVRHFGVVLNATDYHDLLQRIAAQGLEWLSPPQPHEALELSGKLGGKIADPAGNIIEIKHYANPEEYLQGR